MEQKMYSKEQDLARYSTLFFSPKSVTLEISYVQPGKLHITCFLSCLNLLLRHGHINCPSLQRYSHIHTHLLWGHIVNNGQVLGHALSWKHVLPVFYMCFLGNIVFFCFPSYGDSPLSCHLEIWLRSDIGLPIVCLTFIPCWNFQSQKFRPKLSAFFKRAVCKIFTKYDHVLASFWWSTLKGCLAILLPNSIARDPKKNP